MNQSYDGKRENNYRLTSVGKGFLIYHIREIETN
jgi:predicted transcriptional regulator